MLESIQSTAIIILLTSITMPSVRTLLTDAVMALVDAFVFMLVDGSLLIKDIILTQSEGEDAEDTITEGSEVESEKKSQIRSKPGGETKQEEDFEKAPGNADQKGNGVEVKEYPDGRKIIKRPSTHDGRPTIEIQKPHGKNIKVRYDP